MGRARVFSCSSGSSTLDKLPLGFGFDYRVCCEMGVRWMDSYGRGMRVPEYSDGDGGWWLVVGENRSGFGGVLGKGFIDFFQRTNGLVYLGSLKSFGWILLSVLGRVYFSPLGVFVFLVRVSACMTSMAIDALAHRRWSEWVISLNKNEKKTRLKKIERGIDRHDRGS